MTVLAIDPGSEQSAWVLYDGTTVLEHGKQPNASVRARLVLHGDSFDVVVIEQIASYGMAVGAEVFETVHWAGRFYELCTGIVEGHARRMFRRDVKLHLCQSARAKDSNVRQALLDRFGGEKAAKGNKAAPGPLYGLKADEWQALALAVTWVDLHAQKVSA